MRLFLFLWLFASISSTTFAQTRLGVFTGVANYMGDLVEAPYASPRAAFGLSLNVPVGPRLNLRAGLTFAKVAGADSLSSNALYRSRNLNFQSPVTEFSLVGEYNLFNLDNLKWTPYAFAGVAVFHYNPFTYDGPNKIHLQPLGTEGQGIASYNRQPYSLTSFAIPFGGGIKFVLSDKVNLGIEAGLRKTFTDYLDDVSTVYADGGDLLKAHDQRAVDLAFRGDEVRGSTATYPGKGDVRGSAKSKDYYYFTGIHLTFALDNGDGFFRGKSRSGLGCPKVN